MPSTKTQDADVVLRVGGEAVLASSEAPQRTHSTPFMNMLTHGLCTCLQRDLLSVFMVLWCDV